MPRYAHISSSACIDGMICLSLADSFLNHRQTRLAPRLNKDSNFPPSIDFLAWIGFYFLHKVFVSPSFYYYELLLRKKFMSALLFTFTYNGSQLKRTGPSYTECVCGVNCLLSSPTVLPCRMVNLYKTNWCLSVLLFTLTDNGSQLTEKFTGGVCCVIGFLRQRVFTVALTTSAEGIDIS